MLNENSSFVSLKPGKTLTLSQNKNSLILSYGIFLNKIYIRFSFGIQKVLDSIKLLNQSVDHVNYHH